MKKSFVFKVLLAAGIALSGALFASCIPEAGFRFDYQNYYENNVRNWNSWENSKARSYEYDVAVSLNGSSNEMKAHASVVDGVPSAITWTGTLPAGYTSESWAEKYDCAKNIPGILEFFSAEVEAKKRENSTTDWVVFTSEWDYEYYLMPNIPVYFSEVIAPAKLNGDGSYTGLLITIKNFVFHDSSDSE